MSLQINSLQDAVSVCHAISNVPFDLDMVAYHYALWLKNYFHAPLNQETLACYDKHLEVILEHMRVHMRFNHSINPLYYPVLKNMIEGTTINVEPW